MSKNHSQYKRNRSLTENDKIRYLFLNLKQLALAILCLGLALMVILYFAKLQKLLEIIILLFFSITSMGFIIARTKSVQNHLNSRLNQKSLDHTQDDLDDTQ